MKQLIEGNRTQYRHAQEEAIRLFTWLKKFADAYLDALARGGQSDD